MTLDAQMNVPHAQGRGERQMDVVVVGLGYVGAVTAACLADRGHSVTESTSIR
jgi:UDP-N-acetyl-D-mannosaminuronate dehydrogenase